MADKKDLAPFPPNRPAPYHWIAVAIVAPMAMVLPPRRMDWRFFILSGSFSYASDQLLQHYTGQGIYARTWVRLGMDGALPDKAQETQRRMLAERARQSGMTVDERKRFEETQAPKGLWSKMTSANEGENWKERRAQKHEEAIREGKGVGSLIMEQVSEVFGSVKTANKGDKRDMDTKADE